MLSLRIREARMKPGFLSARGPWTEIGRMSSGDRSACIPEKKRDGKLSSR
jgi:hypothetical protein